MPTAKRPDRRRIPLERLRYANDIGKFVRSELDFLGAQTVIDAGCGNGLVSRAIKRQHAAAKLIGIDCSREAIFLAKRNAARGGLRISYRLGDLRNIPLGNGAADVVVCTLVMHHLLPSVRKKALGEFYRVLKKDGVLVILEGKRRLRNLSAMMENAGFGDVKKKQSGRIRNVYSGVKIGNPT